PADPLGLPARRWAYGPSRVGAGAALAGRVIAIINLMQCSQGWVQCGYRFSNDVVPWALLLVAIGLERVARWADRRSGWPISTGLVLSGSALLVVLSVAVNFWGVV